MSTMMTIRAALVAGCLLLAPVAGAASPQPPPPASPPAAQEGFVPIDQLKPKEELPAAPLVMAAYAVAWLLVFAYIWSLWRRLQQVEAEIADLSRRLPGGRR